MAFRLFRRRWVRRILFGMLIFFVIAGLSILYWLQPGKHKFTISEETTRITGPVLDNNKLDYAAALNAKYKQGVTPENNAVVPLVEVIGRSYDGFPDNPDFYTELGIPVPVKSRREFVAWNTAIEDNKETWDEVLQSPETILDYPDLVAWIDQQQEALYLVSQAANRTHWYCPLTPRRQADTINSVVDAPLYGLKSLMPIRQALLLRSMLHTRRGNPNAGWNDLLTVMKLSRLISKAPFAISYLVAISMEIDAWKIVCAFLHLNKLTPEQLEGFLKQLAALPAHEGLTHTYDTGERYGFLSPAVNLMGQGNIDDIRAMAEMGSSKKFTFSSMLETAALNRSVDWDIGLREANQFFDKVNAALMIDDPKTRFNDLHKLITKTRLDGDFPSDYFWMSPDIRGQAACKLLLRLIAPTIRVLTIGEIRMQQHARLRENLFALAKYRAEKGTYPDKIEELTPKYLATIPTDPFSENRPLDYEKTEEGYTLNMDGPKPENPIKLETASKPKEKFIPIRPKGKNVEDD